MVTFPKTVVYDDANKPDWLAVIKENDANPFTVQMTLENWDRIRFDLTNIEGLLVDLNKAVTDAGLTAADVTAFVTFLRFTAPKITVVLNGLGTDTIEIILPPGLTVQQVQKATGETVPFFFNTARNSVVVTVTYASEVTLELLVRSIQNVLNNAVTTITTILVTGAVLNVIFEQVGEIVREVREKA